MDLFPKTVTANHRKSYKSLKGKGHEKIQNKSTDEINKTFK